MLSPASYAVNAEEDEHSPQRREGTKLHEEKHELNRIGFPGVFGVLGVLGVFVVRFSGIFPCVLLGESVF